MYEQFQISMKSLCMVYNVLFQRLLKALEQSGEDLSDGVHSGFETHRIILLDCRALSSRA